MYVCTYVLAYVHVYIRTYIHMYVCLCTLPCIIEGLYIVSVEVHWPLARMICFACNKKLVHQVYYTQLPPANMHIICNVRMCPPLIYHCFPHLYLMCASVWGGFLTALSLQCASLQSRSWAKPIARQDLFSPCSATSLLFSMWATPYYIVLVSLMKVDMIESHVL